jgi:hypothetical protein
MTDSLHPSMRLVLCMVLAATGLSLGIPLSSSATPLAQPSATLPPITTPTEVAVPDRLGLPQPAATQPAPGQPTPVLQSLPQLLRQVQPLPEVKQQRDSTQTTTFDFTGIWQSQEPTPYGTVYSQVILAPDETYSMQTWWLDLLSYEVGVYTLGDGFIHFTVTDYEPKWYKGHWMSRPTSWTAWYTIQDQDTMIWEDRTINTRWTVRRR